MDAIYDFLLAYFPMSVSLTFIDYYSQYQKIKGNEAWLQEQGYSSKKPYKELTEQLKKIPWMLLGQSYLYFILQLAEEKDPNTLEEHQAYWKKRKENNELIPKNEQIAHRLMLEIDQLWMSKNLPLDFDLRQQIERQLENWQNIPGHDPRLIDKTKKILQDTLTNIRTRTKFEQAQDAVEVTASTQSIKLYGLSGSNMVNFTTRSYQMNGSFARKYEKIYRKQETEMNLYLPTEPSFGIRLTTGRSIEIRNLKLTNTVLIANEGIKLTNALPSPYYTVRYFKCFGSAPTIYEGATENNEPTIDIVTRKKPKMIIRDQFMEIETVGPSYIKIGRGPHPPIR